MAVHVTACMVFPAVISCGGRGQGAETALGDNMQQAEFRCPFCRSVIAVGDVNVATDLALCRRCGRTCSFALVTGAVALSPDIVDHPPRRVRVERDFRDGTVLVYRRLSLALLFLIPFTAVWSGGSMYGIYGTQIKNGTFSLGQSLFGLPFLAATLVLLGVIGFLLAGKWRISLRNGAGTVFVGVGPLGWTRRFTYDRNTVVALSPTTVKVNEVPQKGILVRTGEKDFIFGTLLTEDAKRFIAAVIMKAASEV